MTSTNKIRVDKWGNALGIRFPSEFINLAHITERSFVDVLLEGETITVSKVKQKPYKTIEELFDGFDGEYEPVDMEWGKPVGNEIW